MSVKDHRVPRARLFRRQPTEAERKLWWHLRRIELGDSHFRRQATIGPYFADFACHTKKLVIEVDGESHSSTQTIEADRKRSAYLESHGYRVLRFWNNEVMMEIDGVLTAIQTALEEIPPLPPPPRRATRGGRGEEKQA